MKSIRIRVAGIGWLIAVAAAAGLPVAAASGGSPGLAIRSAPGIPPAPPAGTPCAGTSYDANNTTTGIFANLVGPQVGVVLQRFTPATPKFLPTQVCVAGYGNNLTPPSSTGIHPDATGTPGTDAVTQPYDIVIYSDAGGSPGSLLAAVTAAPAAFNGTLTWMTTSVLGSVNPVTGPFWAGVRYTAPGLVLGYDAAPNAATKVVASITGGATFDPPIPGDVYVRVVGFDPDGTGERIPALSGVGLAALVGALAVGGFLILRKA